jgi:hypothetical protein
MSNSKLVKLLNNTKEPPTTEKNFTPVIFTDSKGNCIPNHVRRSHPVERKIIVWCKGEAKIKRPFQLAKVSIAAKSNRTRSYMDICMVRYM